MILIKEKDREGGRGGRKLKWCSFNPRFKFPHNFGSPFSIRFDKSKSTAKDEYIDVEIEDISKTKMDLERIQLTDLEKADFIQNIQQFQVSQNDIHHYQSKLIEAQKLWEDSSQKILDLIKQDEIMQVYSYLLETFSTNKLFSRRDIMSQYHCNFDTAKMITDILERDLGLAEFIETDEEERLPKWRLIDFSNKK